MANFFSQQLGIFLVTVLISVLVIGLFIFSCFSGSLLESCTFLSIYLSLLGCPFCFHTGVHSSLMILGIPEVSVATSPFPFLFLLIWILSLFFLMSLAKGLSILSFQRTFFNFLDFAIVFLVSISFISALISMISFLLLTLDFVCFSFSKFFRCKARLFIWDFSCFLR